jgi:capsular polysaccharide biosynthesis protein
MDVAPGQQGPWQQRSVAKLARLARRPHQIGVGKVRANGNVRDRVAEYVRIIGPSRPVLAPRAVGEQEMEQVGQRPEPDLVTSVTRRWRLVVAFTCVASLVGFVASLMMSRVYEANASLMVGQFGSGDVTINDIKATQSLAATYTDIARREPVMQAVVSDLGMHTSWRELVKNVHTKIPREDPQVIDITVEASSPRLAERIAASVAANVISVVEPGNSKASTFLQNELTHLQSDIESISKRLDALRGRLRTSSTQDAAVQHEITDLHAQLSADQQNYAAFRAMGSPASSAQVSLLDTAHASQAAVRPNVRFNTIIAGFGGLVLGIAAAYLLAARRRNHWDELDGADREFRAEPSVPDSEPEPAASAILASSRELARWHPPFPLFAEPPPFRHDRSAGGIRRRDGLDGSKPSKSTERAMSARSSK